VERRRKHWGWGYEDEQPTPEEVRGAAEFLVGRFGFGSTDPERPVPLSEISLPEPRLVPPPLLRDFSATGDYQRALHAYGRSYADVVRAFRGRFDHPPDVVVHPRNEDELALTLEWALPIGAAVIPFGGGTSVVGGWIATGASRHFATLYTHIDDLVESVRALTPAGVWESRRLPGSGAGVSPDRMLIGSEGTLGIITEAWVRVRRRPFHRASAAVRFKDFMAGAEAVRALSQSGLYPTTCRLIDAREAEVTGAGDGTHAVLVLGFESAEHDVERPMGSALEACADHGGSWERRGDRGGTSDSVGSWREAFLRAPYLRDVFIAIGVLSETFETAITWERFPTFHARVLASVGDAVREICGEGIVTCRFTHVYPDGPAPYYTILAPARRGAELEQWAEIKRVASEAVIEGGGTITHHHAVGREHRPWYDRQRPEPFAAALRAAKRALDPSGALNPGVLIDP
jgi:alkyldihydroxyacetonephosphate synthase